MGRPQCHNAIHRSPRDVDQLVPRFYNGSNSDYNSTIRQLVYRVHGLLRQLCCFTLLAHGLVRHPPLILCIQPSLPSPKLIMNVMQSSISQILLVVSARRCTPPSTSSRVAKLRQFTRGPVDVYSTGMEMALFSQAMPYPHASSNSYCVATTHIFLHCWWLFLSDLVRYREGCSA